ncbi:MAG TPA: sterol desaturase family protein [Kofleriaceae bacterium]|nr:sterol desaturase family protein [Kofleriaceae bacterium]
METLFTLLMPVIFVAMLVVERVAPARDQPKPRRWLFKGIVFFVVTAGVATIPSVLLAPVFQPYAPLHLSELNVFLAGTIAFLVGDLMGYGIHRLQHNWGWAWRWTHQMHHSAERIDVAGSAFTHPFEPLFYAVVVTITSALLGLSPEAAAFAGVLNAITATFAHANIRTPRWVGYVIQRPEAHSIHHTRGVHAYNYGAVVWWDVAFGTYRNPKDFDAGPSGFWNGASTKLWTMLAGRDVAEPTR